MVVTIKETIQSVNANQPSKNDNEMENILIELGGTYGRFQIFNYIMLTVPHIVTGYMVLAYVFTTLNVDYRYVRMRNLWFQW